MLIPSFAMAIFLAGVIWISVNRVLPPAPVGGPIYYAEAPGDRGSIQPRYRLTAWQAFHSKRHVEAYFDDRCLPLMAVHFNGRKQAWRMTWLWDRDGRLRRRLTLDAWGRLVKVEDLE